MSEIIPIGQTAAGEVDHQPLNANADIKEIVRSQEALERTVPLIVYGLFILGTLIASAVHHGDTVNTLIILVFFIFVAKFVVWLARPIVLAPIRHVRYERAAGRLRQQLKENWPLSLGPYAWTLGAPGVLGATENGDLIIVSQPTKYKSLRIPAKCIADVRVERRSHTVTTTKHSGRSLIGTNVGSIGVGYASGGRSSSVTKQIDDFSLEIRYQLERNGMVSTLVVPGGSDHQVVEELCAAIKRLEPACTGDNL